jgi:hypothetical protein
MIRGTWVDPNFKFRASDAENIVYESFCYAEGEDDQQRQRELESRLRHKGLTVEWTEPYDFGEWRSRARVAREKAVDAYKAGKRPIRFNQAIWAELKWHLFDLFHDKCAFCESRISAVGCGEVEHYRPKSRVSESPDHPGYYWCAYETSNLLPACALCNQYHGKGTRFPVRGQRVYRPDEDLGKEEPLLLNPYDSVDEPEQHLMFHESGRVLPATERGDASIEIYSLNRRGLLEARRLAIAHALVDYNVLTGIFSDATTALGALLSMITPNQEYSLARKQVLGRALRHDRLKLFGVNVTEAFGKVFTPDEIKRAGALEDKQAKSRESFSIESSSAEERQRYKAGFKGIEKIEIRNFKAVRDLTLEIPPASEEQESWLMLVGENGCGKSTILKAIALLTSA